MQKSNLLKILCLICFIFLSIILINIYISPNNGYELSIYQNIPIIILLPINIYLGFIIAFISIKHYKNNNFFLQIGYLIMLFNFFIILIFPIIKGYEFFGLGDVLTHVGYEIDILNIGHIALNDFYPILHIFIVNITLMTSLDLRIIMKYLPPIISIFFIISIYILFNQLFEKKKQVYVASLISTIPFLASYYTGLVPNGLSLMLMPTILYLFFKSRKEHSAALSILLIIFLIIIPFSHPLTSIFLIIFLIMIEFSNKAYYFNKKNKYSISFEAILILLITFFTWISSSFIFTRSISKIFSWTKGELYAPTEQVNQAFNKLNFSLMDRIIIFLKMYGTELVFLILALSAFYIIIKKMKKDQTKINLFSLGVILTSTLFILVFFVFTGDPNFEPIRSMNFVFMLSIPLAGYLIFEIYERFSQKKLIIPILSLLLTLLFINSAIAIYPSPYISQPNPQISKSHLNGMEWFLINKDTNINSLRMESAAPSRFTEFIYGLNTSKERIDLIKYISWTVIPDHLTYDKNSEIGQNVTIEKNKTVNKYFPVAKVDILSYTKIWQAVGRYSDEDFNKLKNDKSADKIYSNGDFDIWFIFPV